MMHMRPKHNQAFVEYNILALFLEAEVKKYRLINDPQKASLRRELKTK
jgi:hypothetical protein